MRILIADGSEPVRSALRRLLDDTPGVTFVTAADVAQARRRCAEGPDAAILSLGLAGGSTLDVLAHARRVAPLALLIVLGNGHDDAARDACFELGADHFLDKHSDFYQAVHLVRERHERSQ